MAGENTQEATDRISLLQDEISRLEQHEKMLDQHKLVSSLTLTPLISIGGLCRCQSMRDVLSDICRVFQWAQQSIKNILEDVTNYQLAYTTHNDICSVFPGETLLAIQVGKHNLL